MTSGIKILCKSQPCLLHRACVRCVPNSNNKQQPNRPNYNPLQKLQRAGFISVRDVKATRGPIDLARGTPQNDALCWRSSLTAPPSPELTEADLTNEQASEVMKFLRFGTAMPTTQRTNAFTPHLPSHSRTIRPLEIYYY